MFSSSNILVMAMTCKLDSLENLGMKYKNAYTYQKLDSNEFHQKSLLCTILHTWLREAVGGQIGFGSERLEML